MHNNNSVPPAVLAGLEPFGRRRFLRYSLLAGTTVLAGCANLFGKKTPEVAEVAEVQPAAAVGAEHALTPAERAVFEKLTRVIMPVGDHGYLDTQTIPVIESLDTMVRGMPPFIRERLNLAVTAFDTGSILLSFRFRRFSTLSDEEALKYVDAWHEGTFIQRGAITSLKVLVCVNYWRDQRAAAKIHYDGPVTEKWGVPRLGNQLLPRT